MKIYLIHHSPHVQKLNEDELIELEQAWKSDKEQEKKVKNKKEKVKGFCMANCFSCCKREDRQTKLLKEIHEAAIKQQSKIAKEHQVKAEKPFKDSVFSKVRRGIFLHDCLSFVLFLHDCLSFVRQHPLTLI